MNGLFEIKGIGKTSLELLEAVGITDVSELAELDPTELHGELKAANKVLKIAGNTPPETKVASWISFAQECNDRSEGPTRPSPEDDQSVVTEKKTVLPEPVLQVVGEIEVGMARIVSPQLLISQGVQLKDVPVARVLPPSAVPLPGPKKRFSTLVKTTRQNSPIRLPVGKAEPSKPEAVEPNGAKVPVFGKVLLGEGRVGGPTELVPRSRGLLTTVKEGTNAGRNQHSRWYIRGVLYPRVGLLRASAVIVILTLLLIPLSIVGSLMVIFEKELIWLICPGLLLVFALAYFFTAIRPRCRICGQSIFLSKRCLRHEKAHHVKFLGYILPTAVQLLIFRWFRCSYCGTAIRTKE